jgi:hypothetical protein
MRPGRTILDDYLRELRPRYLPRRTYQRTLYRPGELLQFDLFEPREPIPVGHGQTRRGFVVTAELCFSRALAARVLEAVPRPGLRDEPLSRAPGRAAAEARLGPGGRHPRRRRPPQRGVRRLLRPARRRLDHPRLGRRRGQGPARALAPVYALELRARPALRHQLDYQAQLDAWTDGANARTHRATRAVPAERLREERARMRPLPERRPETDRRFVWRVPQQPTCASTPTTTRSIPGSPAAASRSGSPSASLWRWRSTPASWPAATAAPSPAT